MGELAEDVAEQLLALGFAVQRTSYDAITSNEDLKDLRDVKLPDCDASRILRFFPQYFAVHREAKPEDGIFFVVLGDSVESLPVEARAIYDRYFPDRVAVIGHGHDGGLVARWYHAPGAGEPLRAFLKREMGVG